MSTLSALIDKGVKRMRLPDWNDEAYIEPRETGPWADIHDVGDAAIPVLISVCDDDERWVAVDE